MNVPSAIPLFGPDGDPCPSCRAPLAGNQRYCLYCGARRPQARLEFLDALADRPAVLPAHYAVAPAAPAAGFEGWLRERGPLLGLAGLMLGTLIAGLLVGHWATASSSEPVAAAPARAQVITIAGGTAAPAAAATTTGATAASSSSKAKATAKKAAAATTTVPKGTADVKTLDKKAVEKLARKKAPISTGTGAPPPKDNKAPAGGSDFETIG